MNLVRAKGFRITRFWWLPIFAYGLLAWNSAKLLCQESNAPALVENAALSVIANHLNAVRSATWTGIHAKGRISIWPSTVEEDADLTVSASGRVELIVAGGTYLKSYKSNGLVAEADFADGSKTFYGFEAANAGLFQFQWLRYPSLSNQIVSLRDKSPKGIANNQEYVLAAKLYRAAGTKRSATSASSHARMSSSPIDIEFSFNPITLLLDQTSLAVGIPGMANNHVPLVTTYADYRDAGESLMPYHITQMLEGQQQWDLRLTSITPLSTPSTTAPSL